MKTKISDLPVAERLELWLLMEEGSDQAILDWANKRAKAHAASMPIEPPQAAIGILIGYDTLEHLNDCDQEVLVTRARFRWNQLLAAGISALAAAQGRPS